MSKYMLSKSRFTKQFDDGTFRRVTEQHLVSGDTFTEAEANIYEALGTYIRGEFAVTALQIADFHDIIRTTQPEDSAKNFFKVKITFSSIDDDARTKKSSINVLIEEDSVEKATIVANDQFAGLYNDFYIDSVVLTKIVDVFSIEREEEQGEEEE